jgi:hypothetical protein
MVFGAIYKISLFLENAFHKMHHWVGIFECKMLRKGYKNKSFSNCSFYGSIPHRVYITK